MQDPSQQADHAVSGLDLRKVSRGAVVRQVTAAIIGCLCMIVTGCWMAWPSPSLHKLLTGNARVRLDEEQASWVVALLDVGNMVSPLPVAFLVDKLGRKTLMLFTGPLFLAAALLTFPTSSHFYLYLGRFFTGIGKGVSFTVVPMYLGEIASVKIRGALSTLAIGFLWAGTLTTFVVGPLVSYDLLNITLAVIPVVFFLLFIWMPESPYSLLMNGKQEKARDSIFWLRDGSAHTDQEVKAMKDNVDEDMQTKGTFKELLTIASNRRAATIVMATCVFQRFCGVSSLLSYSSTTLPKESGLPLINNHEIMVLFGVALMVGNFLVTPLVDSWGRKPLLLLSSVGTSLCTGISGIYYLLIPSLDRLTWVPYMSLLGFAMLQAIGLGVIPQTLLSEMFPANVKAKAAALSSIVLALSSFCTNKMYFPVKRDFGVQYMFFFFSFSSFISLLFTITFVFETKGKTFPEIQAKLKNG